jgi:hypothetical protein
MQRKVHDKPDEFGEDFAKEAIEWAKRERGGDLTESVEYQATITVSPGSVIVCVSFGSIFICYKPGEPGPEDPLPM